MNMLDEVIARENAREIVGHLSGPEFLIVALAIDGLSGAQIADSLGVSRALICRRLGAARKRILGEIPELSTAVAGRSSQRGVKHRRNGRAG